MRRTCWNACGIMSTDASSGGLAAEGAWEEVEGGAGEVEEGVGGCGVGFDVEDEEAGEGEVGLGGDDGGEEDCAILLEEIEVVCVCVPLKQFVSELWLTSIYR